MSRWGVPILTEGVWAEVKVDGEHLRLFSERRSSSTAREGVLETCRFRITAVDLEESLVAIALATLHANATVHSPSHLRISMPLYSPTR